MAQWVKSSLDSSRKKHGLTNMSIERGTIFFLKWDGKRGLTERAVTFETLSELFRCSCSPRPGETVDRVIMEARAPHGVRRRVTYRFQCADASVDN